MKFMSKENITIDKFNNVEDKILTDLRNISQLVLSLINHLTNQARWFSTFNHLYISTSSTGEVEIQ